MKRLFQLIVCLGIVTSSFGQFSERLFFQVGGTVGADVMNLTGTLAKGVNKLESNFTSNNVNFATLALVGRINFLELTNNTSLSLAARPSASFGRSFNESGGMSNFNFHVPFTLDFNSGAASTVSTRAKTGFSIGGGIEYVGYPVGKSIAVTKEEAGNNGVQNYTRDFKANWWQPVVVVGIKFFGKHYYCREINFKASFASITELENKTSSDEKGLGTVSDFKSVGLMVSFLQYINY